jgi:nicotinamidase-related amidase
MRNTEALIIVDLQHDFYSPDGALSVPNAESIIGPIARHADRFRQGGGLVVTTTDWHPVDHCSFEEQGGPFPVHCVAGTPGAALHPQIAALDAPNVYKAFASDDDPGMDAFGGVVRYQAGDEQAFVPLSMFFGVKRITRVHVCGLTKEFCVPATAKGALASGFEVCVPTPFTVALDYDAGIASMRELKALGAEIV